MINTSWFIGAALSALISANAIFVIVYGSIGTAGNAFFSGAVFSLSIAVIFFLSFRRIVVMPADYLFGAFLLVIAASMAVNGRTSSPKEYALLLLVLATYPAFRMIPFSRVEEVRNDFVWFVSAIVVVGTILTGYSLATGSRYSAGGHPFVIGFADAPTQFFSAMCFVVVALTSRRLTLRSTFCICALIFVPLTIFSASMVRALFIALVGSLILVAILSTSKQRAYVVAVILTVCAAVLTAPPVQLTIAAKSTAAVVEGAGGGDTNQNMTASCNLDVNKADSIAVRKILLADSLYFAQRSGPIGFGLDSFPKLECIDIFQVHNSFLQAAVEFGWLGGVILSALVAVAGLPLLRLACRDESARFVVCSFALAVAIAMVHGRISRDFALFAFMGWAVNIKEHYRSSSSQGPLGGKCHEIG
ncbi:O-antigen ligase family protein [Bradyrhizobium sp. Leo121]|uniref:O-antigen ligase family protein n=1 Tax=Bradyrhizobium sp. Leo121 TaxID=1571195 RepID=UPI00102A7358|nr:O-antigen ligase family protein [Bradyrhizobium sp. Leo121]RZN35328.1 hypothetical protein CWO90_03810 [Bradyrhizobium sp. Leo121]